MKAYHTLESQLGIFLFFSCSLCIHIVTKDPGPSLRKMSISFQLLLFLLGKAMMSITMSLHLAGAAAFFILMFFTSPIQAAGGDCMGGKFSSFFFFNEMNYRKSSHLGGYFCCQNKHFIASALSRSRDCKSMKTAI